MRTCRSASSGRGHKALTECVAKAPHAVQLRREGLTVQALFEAALSEEEKPNRCHQMVECRPVLRRRRQAVTSSPPATTARNVTTQSSGSSQRRRDVAAWSLQLRTGPHESLRSTHSGVIRSPA